MLTTADLHLWAFDWPVPQLLPLLVCVPATARIFRVTCFWLLVTTLADKLSVPVATAVLPAFGERQPPAVVRVVGADVMQAAARVGAKVKTVYEQPPFSPLGFFSSLCVPGHALVSQPA
jgi:hypothetical protein